MGSEMGGEKMPGEAMVAGGLAWKAVAACIDAGREAISKLHSTRRTQRKGRGHGEVVGRGRW